MFSPSAGGQQLKIEMERLKKRCATLRNVSRAGELASLRENVGRLSGEGDRCPVPMAPDGKKPHWVTVTVPGYLKTLASLRYAFKDHPVKRGKVDKLLDALHRALANEDLWQVPFAQIKKRDPTFYATLPTSIHPTAMSRFFKETAAWGEQTLQSQQLSVKDPAAREAILTMLSMIRSQSAAFQAGMDANDARHDEAEQQLQALAQQGAELEEKAVGTAHLFNLQSSSLLGIVGGAEGPEKKEHDNCVMCALDKDERCRPIWSVCSEPLHGLCGPCLLALQRKCQEPRVNGYRLAWGCPVCRGVDPANANFVATNMSKAIRKSVAQRTAKKAAEMAAEATAAALRAAALRAERPDSRASTSYSPLPESSPADYEPPNVRQRQDYAASSPVRRSRMFPPPRPHPPENKS